MSVENSVDINTRPLILEEYPVAVRKDDAVMKQDAGRTTVLASKTLVGKLAVAAAVAAAADAGNTGDGTVTVSTVVGINAAGEKIIPKVGIWLLTLTAALVATLTDPDGVDRVTGIALNDGTTTVVKYAGLQFTVTDGAIAFIATDEFTLTVAVDGDYTPYDPASVLGADKPAGFYDPEGNLGEITAAALVAGDVADVPVLIAGALFDSEMLVMETGALTDMVADTGLTVEEYLRRVSLIAENAISNSSPENS
jgi:hypothetical protein